MLYICNQWPSFTLDVGRYWILVVVSPPLSNLLFSSLVHICVYVYLYLYVYVYLCMCLYINACVCLSLFIAIGILGISVLDRGLDLLISPLMLFYIWIYLTLFVYMCIYIWACVLSTRLCVYFFACLCVGICIYVLACLCVHMPGLGLSACSTGSPRLQFFFFGLGVFSLTLVVWEWMLQGVLSSDGMLIVARVQCSMWTKPFLGPLGVCLGVLWLWFCTLP